MSQSNDVQEELDEIKAQIKTRRDSVINSIKNHNMQGMDLHIIWQKLPSPVAGYEARAVVTEEVYRNALQVADTDKKDINDVMKDATFLKNNQRGIINSAIDPDVITNIYEIATREKMVTNINNPDAKNFILSEQDTVAVNKSFQKNIVAATKESAPVKIPASGPTPVAGTAPASNARGLNMVNLKANVNDKINYPNPGQTVVEPMIQERTRLLEETTNDITQAEQLHVIWKNAANGGVEPMYIMNDRSFKQLEAARERDPNHMDEEILRANQDNVQKRIDSGQVMEDMTANNYVMDIMKLLKYKDILNDNNKSGMDPDERHKEAMTITKEDVTKYEKQLSSILNPAKVAAVSNAAATTVSAATASTAPASSTVSISATTNKQQIVDSNAAKISFTTNAPVKQVEKAKQGLIVNVLKTSKDGTVVITQLVEPQSSEFMKSIDKHIAQTTSVDGTDVKTLTADGAALASDFLAKPDLNAVKSSGTMPTTIDHQKAATDILKSLGSETLKPDFVQNKIKEKSANATSQNTASELQQLQQEKLIIEDFQNNPASKWKVYVLEDAQKRQNYVLYNSDNAQATDSAIKDSFMKGYAIDLGFVPDKCPNGPVTDTKRITEAASIGNKEIANDIQKVERHNTMKERIADPSKAPQVDDTLSNQDIVKSFAKTKGNEKGEVPIEGKSYSMVSVNQVAYIVPAKDGATKEEIKDLISRDKGIPVADLYNKKTSVQSFDQGNSNKISTTAEKSDGVIGSRSAKMLAEQHVKTNYKAESKSNIRTRA